MNIRCKLKYTSRAWIYDKCQYVQHAEGNENHKCWVRFEVSILIGATPSKNVKNEEKQ